MTATLTTSPPRPFRIQNSEFRIRAPRAFTLIELMVVVAIIVILTAITLPAVKALTQGNNQKQAVNLITTLIAAARANAIQGHTQAGIVVFEDPAAQNQSSVQLIVQSTYTSTANSGLNTYFVRSPRTVAQRLPLGIKVATLDDTTTSQFFTSDATSSNGPRIILFDANGQLVLHSYLYVDPSYAVSVPPDPTTPSWNMTTSPGGISRPSLVVYDGAAVNAAKTAGAITSDSTLYLWLQQHADLIVINPYTGNIIR